MARRKLIDAAKAAEAERDLEERQAIRERSRNRATAAGLRREIRILEAELEAEREINAALLTLDETGGDTHTLPPLRRSTKNRATSVALASDWHTDEIVEASKVSGINSFNSRKADSCINEYFNRVPRISGMFGTGYTLQRHIQWFGGDLFTGHLHEDNIETVSRSPVESCAWLRPRITAGVEAMLDRVKADEITVVWSYGNHGRTTHKPRIATASRHNFEWLLGQWLMADFGVAKSGGVVSTGKGRPKLRWIAESGYHTYVQEAGMMLRFHHGDWIRCGGKVQHLVSRLKTAIEDWNRARRADFDFFGHYHTTLDLPWAIGNGSMIGYNAYAQSIKATPEPRQQAFALFDLERREKAAFAKIHLD